MSCSKSKNRKTVHFFQGLIVASNCRGHAMEMAKSHRSRMKWVAETNWFRPVWHVLHWRYLWGIASIYHQVQVRRWQLQGVSLHDTDNSFFEANNLHVHKYRLRCPKLHIRNDDFLLSCLTCECYFVICYSVCGVSLSLSALLCITRWHQCQ